MPINNSISQAISKSIENIGLDTSSSGGGGGAFDPGSVGNLILNLDANNSDSLTLEDVGGTNMVRSWASPTTTTAYQFDTTAAAGATTASLISNGLNSLPAMLCRGDLLSNQFLKFNDAGPGTSTDFNFLHNATGMTLVTVFHKHLLNKGFNWFGNQPASGNGFLIYSLSNDSLTVDIRDSVTRVNHTTAAGYIDTTKPQILSVRFIGTTCTIQLDSDTPITATVSGTQNLTSVSTELRLGATSNEAAQMVGYTGQFLLYDEYLSDSSLDDLIVGLNGIWGTGA